MNWRSTEPFSQNKTDAGMLRLQEKHKRSSDPYQTFHKGMQLYILIIVHIDSLKQKTQTIDQLKYLQVEGETLKKLLEAGEDMGEGILIPIGIIMQNTIVKVTIL